MAKQHENDVLLNHNYDGIQELDNDLPPWWLWLFYITIIWSVIYLIHYHVIGTGDSSAVEYLKEMDPDWEQTASKSGFSIEYRSPLYTGSEDLTPLTRVQIAIAREKEEARLLAEKKAMGEVSVSLSDISFDEIIMAAMSAATPEDLEKLQTAFPQIYETYQKGGGASEGEAAAAAVEEEKPKLEMDALTDAASLASGEATYVTHCATCHGKLGEGGIGPNFADNYFIHGNTIGDMVTVVNNGVAAKGMISWRGILKDKEIHEVVSYIQTFQGTNPPNAKDPQGEKIETAVQ
jgi:mono/diheme cytochrome c family protein